MRRIALAVLGFTACAILPTAACAPGAEPVTDENENGSAQDELSTAPDARPVAPSDVASRFLTCPVRQTNEVAEATFRGTRYAYTSDAEMRPREPGWEGRATFDDHALDGLVPADASALLIDIRRVNGKPAYAYFGANGRAHATYEPWSSAKFEAASAALARVRAQSSLGVGGPADAGNVSVGDLVTAMHAYRPVGNATGSSNAIAGYFLTVAGAAQTNALFGSRWLNLTDDTSEFHVSATPGRTRSAWGEAPFSPGSNVWRDPGSGRSVTVTPDTRMVDDKNMSALAQGEWLKRLTQHLLVPSSSLPGIQRADLEVLFYGDPDRAGPGGMLAGVSNYIANAVAGTGAADPAELTRDRLAQRAGPNWRIFHKVGWGNSTSRSRSEVVFVSYACLPELDGGREFVLVLNTSVPLSSVQEAGRVAQLRTNAIIAEALAIQ